MSGILLQGQLARFRNVYDCTHVNPSRLSRNSFSTDLYLAKKCAGCGMATMLWYSKCLSSPFSSHLAPSLLLSCDSLLSRRLNLRGGRVTGDS